jgi:glycerol uptake facilitator protein
VDETRRITAYIAELVGTFLLVLFIGLILADAGSAMGAVGYKDILLVGVVHAFVLMMLVQSLGSVSGAHFNPAVTVALAALRKIEPIDGAIYICMQLVGGVLAALVVKLIVHDPGATVHYGAPLVSDALHGHAFTGMLCELIGTFVLMWAIMGMAVNPRAARDWAGLVIGATLGFAVMVFAPLTGAGLNPARSFGPSLVGGGESAGRFLLVYVLGPAVGALLAAVAYRQLVLVPQERLPGERPVDKLP